MTQSFTLHMSSEMAEAIMLVARSEDATVGEIIRDAVRRDLRRRATLRNERLEKQRQFEPLRDLLAQDFERAESWPHLQSRLLDKGYRLAAGQGDMAIHRATGGRICQLSDIGISYADLAKRFSVPKRRMADETTALAS